MTALSVIIPTQGRKCLTEALDSIRSQADRDRVEIIVVGDTHAAPDLSIFGKVQSWCREFDAKYIAHDAGFNHWGHCLPGSAVVESPDMEMASRREYSGPMLEIMLRGGRLTISPDHPVLTVSGWVAAGEIKQGDYLIRASFDDRILAGRPDKQWQPAEIGQQFDALAIGGNRKRMPRLSMNLDGDGGASEIDIVWPDRQLRNDAAHASILQPAEQFALTVTDLVYSGRLSSNGLSSQLLGRILVPETSGSPGGGEPLAQFIGSRAPANSLSGASAAERYSLGPKPIRDARWGNSVIHSEGGQNDTGSIALDEVVHVRRFHADSHVYDLQTKSGWYLADGLVVHNCQANFAMPLASGARLAFLGDDDIYMPGAIDAMASCTAALSLFRADMRKCKKTVWEERGALKCGSISAQCIVVKNDKAHLGTWGTGPEREGDYAFIRTTVDQWGGEAAIDWREEVIAECRDI